MNLLKPFLLLLAATVCHVASAQEIETVLQLGHELSVLSIQPSPDSNLVMTGSRDKSAKLWELSTGREIRSFLGHEGSVNCIAFSSDGKHVLTSSGDMTAKLWEVVTGELLFTTPKGEKYLTAVAFSPNDQYFVTAGYPNMATVWDFKTRKPVTQIKVNADQGAGYGINLAFSPDGKWLAIGEDNRTANVYTTSNWEKKYTFDYESGWCGGCATWVDFTSDSKVLLMASNKAPVKTYDLSNGKLIKTFIEEIEDLRGLAYDRTDRRIMVATESEIIVLDATTGAQVTRAKPELDGKINEAKFDLRGNNILIASDNNQAFAWNYQTEKITARLTGLLNERDKGGMMYDPNSYWESHIAKYIRFKNKLLLSQDGKELIKGKFGTKVKRWDIASGQLRMEYVGHEKAVISYDLSKDGSRLLTGGGEGRLTLWNTATGDTIKTIEAHREPIFDVQFSHSEKSVASASWDGSIKIFDLATGKRTHYFDLQNNSAYHFQFYPNDLYLVIAKLDHSLQLVEIDTQKPVRDFIGHTNMIGSIALSEDGSQLLSSGWDGTVRLWNVNTGLMVQKFTHPLAVHSSIFSSDGKSIYTAGADRNIRQWDIASATIVRMLEGHTAEITSLSEGRDRKMLISHSLDGITKFWDLQTGAEFFEHIHFGEREWMAKNPAGYFNGTDKARQYIHFVDGTATYAVDQFFNQFYRPDLLPSIFQSRGGEQLKSVGQVLQKSPPPTVKVAVLPTNDPTKVEVHAQVTNEGAGASALRFFHNGKQVPLTASFDPPANGKSSRWQQTVAPVAGLNTFAVSAVNVDGIESEQVKAVYFSEQGPKASTCYLFSVGINSYKNPKLTLNYAKPDAESFVKLVDEKGAALFRETVLITLYDEHASKANILKKLDELADKVRPEDVFILYYAGHGSMVDNQFYFVPTESLRLYDASSLKKEAIEATLLQEKLRNIKALKQLIVMDACQSGGSVELLATRGATEEKAIAQLSRSAGIHVMASAGSEQFAAEFAELGHGLFTYLLIKGLQGEADGAPKDGKVTIYELKSFLDDQVPEWTKKLKGKPQYPYTFSRGHDFPVVIKEN